ncbi:MAG: hypothetical protein ACK4TP_06415 [Hyphomicrobium sp.]|jgi:hypothetical protein
MRSSLQAALLAATAALSVALGAAAAHAGDYTDYLAAQHAAAAIDEMTGGDSLVSEAVEAAASEAALDALIGAVEEVAEE